MKVGRAIIDTQIKAIKTLLKESVFRFTNVDANFSELTNAVVKIQNIRKYTKSWGEHFIFEVDVVVDMNNKNGWFYSNDYCERYKLRHNRYYRRKIEKVIEGEIQYFGFNNYYDNIEVKKITYKEIV